MIMLKTERMLFFVIDNLQWEDRVSTHLLSRDLKTPQGLI